MRRLLSLTILGLGAFAFAGCDDASSVGGDGGGGSSSGSSTGGSAPDLPRVDKVDIVLGIDNSRSMADKQQILSAAVADLVQSLVNPPCVDLNGAITSQPPTGNDACPAGSARQHLPINDIHIGILSSSIGGHGSDSCPASETQSCPGGAVNTSNDDNAHLLSRSDPCTNAQVPTYQSQGFLAWDPQQVLSPPGELDAANLMANVKTMVLGAGQIGCGYESQMESWYRFLVDPEPYQTIELDQNARAVPTGIDMALLTQRAEFLRPDSLLAIVMLSDENDCSVKAYDQFYLASQQRDPSSPAKNFYLPKARSECATNPNDPCCKSCAQDPGECPVDPTCGTLDAKTDDVNLRCWDEKRRFGIDFLYPIDRYVQGLQSQLVPTRAGDLVPNPIFSDLIPGDSNSTIRDPGLVILSGIVGVPWQDLARDPSDLQQGYKSAEELAHANAGITTWDVILGDPAAYVAPLDPHMIESPDARSGTDPLTGTPLAPPGSAAGADPINGHEWTVGTKNGVVVAKDDLQYACIFPLATPRDCSVGGGEISCDCGDPQNDNPLCEPDPAHGGDRTLQVRAKGYPGIRQLSAIRSLGPSGVVSSICPAQQNDPTRTDYAYRPAVRALLERVKSRLKLVP